MPSAVVAAMVRELEGLSEPARRLAEAGAVAGDPFELDLALATAGMGEQDGSGRDRRARRPRPCAIGRRRPRRFHFRHPLVRHAVYEACAPGMRLAAHERCANALAAQGAPAAMRAHHVQYAARQGDLGAVAVLREAGEAAARRAPASAARWFELALGLLPEAAPREDRASLLMALAETEAAGGRFEESREALLDGLALTTDDEQELRLQLIVQCASLEQLLGRHEEAHSRLTAALDSRSDTSSAEAVALIIHLAVGSLYRLDFAGMREWSERALDARGVARRPPLTAASTAVLAVADAFTGHVPGRRGPRLGGRGPGGRPLRSGTGVPPRRAREPLHRGALPPPIPRGRRARQASPRRGPGVGTGEHRAHRGARCWPTSCICGDRWPSPARSSTRRSTRPGSRATWRRWDGTCSAASFTAVAAGDVSLALPPHRRPWT